MRRSHGLEYKLSDNGAAVLCGIGSCESDFIYVPESVDGFTVIGVEKKAFCRCEQIKGVVLPSSVKYIAAQAFAWCRNLESIVLDGAVEIKDRAFIGCDKLSKVKFGSALEAIGEKAFAHCPAVTEAQFPDSLELLGSGAFEGCRNLRSVSLSDNVRVIENGTFYGCTSLQKVSLPENLEYIDEYAFAYCISIADMNIPSKTVINCEAFFESENICLGDKVS